MWTESLKMNTYTLFRNKGFLVNLKTKRNSSKFAMFMEKENQHTVFFVVHLEQLSFSPYECLGLCRHRPEHSGKIEKHFSKLRKKKLGYFIVTITL